MAAPLPLHGVAGGARVERSAATAGPTLDPRAVENGREIADHLSQGPDACVMITGPSHTGKTQTAIAARRLLDPDGGRSLHTSAAILANNATLVPSDRSATWQSWGEVRARLDSGVAPKLVIIDEAGSRGPPSSPATLEEAFARQVLAGWRDAGTRFIVIGHSASPALTAWAEWLSGPSSHYAALDTRD